MTDGNAWVNLQSFLWYGPLGGTQSKILNILGSDNLAGGYGGGEECKLRNHQGKQMHFRNTLVS